MGTEVMLTSSIKAITGYLILGLITTLWEDGDLAVLERENGVHVVYVLEDEVQVTQLRPVRVRHSTLLLPRKASTGAPRQRSTSFAVCSPRGLYPAFINPSAIQAQHI